MKKQLLTIIGSTLIAAVTFAQSSNAGAKLIEKSGNPKALAITGTPGFMDSYTWNTTAFDTTSVDAYTYDGSSRQTIDITQTYKTHQYTNSQKSIYYYISTNTTDNPDSASIYSWTAKTNSWDRSYQEYLTYQDQQKGTPKMLDLYSSGFHFISIVYTYDVNGHVTKVTSKLMSTAKATFGQIFPNDSTNVTTDGSGNATATETFSWDLNKSVFTPASKKSSTYDGNNNLLVETEMSYDTSASVMAYVNYQRTTHTYDANNNETLSVNEMWDATSSGYLNNSRTTTVYKNTTELDNQLVESWDKFNSKYVNDKKYIWSNTSPLGIALQGLSNLFSVFPNPGSGFTNVIFNLNSAQPVQVKMFDVTGKEVSVLADGIMDAGIHTINTNTASLAKGIYFIRLQNGNNTSTQKLIVE